MSADDDLDALLDDALENFDQAEEEEAKRQEERKKAAPKAAGAEPSGDELAQLLETTLEQLKGSGSEEDKGLQELVEQGLSIMKGGDDADDAEVFKQCLGLLEKVSSEIGKGAPDGENAGAQGDEALNPFLQQLSKTVGDVVSGLQNTVGNEGGDGAPNEEEQQKLLSVLQQLGSAANGSGAEGSPDEMKKMMEAFAALQGGGESGEEGAVPEELKKMMEGNGEGLSEMMKAMSEMMKETAGKEATPEEKADLERLKKEMAESMGEVPEEVRGQVEQFMSVLDQLAPGNKPSAEKAAEGESAATSSSAPVAPEAPDAPPVKADGEAAKHADPASGTEGQ